MLISQLLKYTTFVLFHFNHDLKMVISCKKLQYVFWLNSNWSKKQVHEISVTVIGYGYLSGFAILMLSLVLKIFLLWKDIHCVKVSKYGVFSGPYFSVFRLNTGRYGVYLRIQSKCGKIWTRKSSVFGHLTRGVFRGSLKILLHILI